MKRIIAAMTVLVAAASLANAAEIPDTPAGHALSMWITAVNSGDAAKLQAYIDRYHRKSTPQVWLGLRQVTGDLSVLKLNKNEPNDIIAIVGESQADDVLRVEYHLDPADPTKIIFAQTAGVDRPDDLAIPRLSQDAALKALNGRVG